MIEHNGYKHLSMFFIFSVKPFLHQPGMYDIEIKKGRTFRYDIWFGGEPPPTITWERNGVGVKKDAHTSIDLFR